MKLTPCCLSAFFFSSALFEYPSVCGVLAYKCDPAQVPLLDLKVNVPRPGPYIGRKHTGLVAGGKRLSRYTAPRPSPAEFNKD